MEKKKKTALITGASRGLGLALARELARQGWSLIIDARDRNALETARTELARLTQVRAIAGDIADLDHQMALAAEAKEASGIYLVVNNASILGPSPQPSLLDYPLGVLEQVFRVNVFSPLSLVQKLRNTLSSDPVVINITSDAGIEAYEGWGGYGASKAALEHMSAVLAQENPKWHIYWVDPGDMRTQMQQEAFPGEDISDRPLPETSVPGLLMLIQGRLPSGRYLARKVIEMDRSVS